MIKTITLILGLITLAGVDANAAQTKSRESKVHGQIQFQGSGGRKTSDSGT